MPTAVSQGRGDGSDTRVEPGGFPLRYKLSDQRVVGVLGIECLAVKHGGSCRLSRDQGYLRAEACGSRPFSGRITLQSPFTYKR